MVYRIELDPADSKKLLKLPGCKLAFGMEIDFLAELKKNVFIQTDRESVGHVLLERLQLLRLDCIASHSHGCEIAAEGADVGDPNMPYYLNDGDYPASSLHTCCI